MQIMVLGRTFFFFIMALVKARPMIDPGEDFSFKLGHCSAVYRCRYPSSASAYIDKSDQEIEKDLSSCPGEVDLKAIPSLGLKATI